MRVAYVFIIAVFFVLNSAYSQCDSTFTVASTLGTTGSPYNPAVLNQYLSNLDSSLCPDVVVCTMRFNCCERGDLPVYLSDSINIPAIPGISAINLSVLPKTDGLNPEKKLMLTRLAGGGAIVMSVSTPNFIISDLAFKQTFDSPWPLVVINASAKGVKITNSLFELSSTGGNAVLINADSARIERNYFRHLGQITGPTSTSLSLLFGANTKYSRVEHNVFLNTTLFINGSHMVIFANSFLGGIGSKRSLVEFGSSVLTNFTISRNLFAVKSPLQPPIGPLPGANFASPNDSIFNNAYNSTLSSPVIWSAAANGDYRVNNVVLPVGLANYEEGDYPLYQFRRDSLLDLYRSDFGIIPKNYLNFTSDIQGDLSSKKDYFGSTYSLGVQVGAFGSKVELWDFILPSPLASLSFAVDSIRVRRTGRVFDTTYYAVYNPPSHIFYFFSNNKGALAGKDTTSLKNAGAYWDGLAYSSEGNSIGGGVKTDSLLDIPRALRNGIPFHIKMVHSHDSGFAHTNDSAIVTISNAPKYPITDFSLTVRPNNQTKHDVGSVDLNFSPGAELLDSVRIFAYDEANNSVIDTLTVPVSNRDTAIQWTGFPRGGTYFRAAPIGIVGNGSAVGSVLSNSTTIVQFKPISSDTLWVSYRDACTLIDIKNSTGSSESPFCNVRLTLQEFTVRPLTLILKSGSGTIPNLQLANDSSQGGLTITSEAYVAGQDTARPVIQNLTVSGSGIKLSGLILEHSLAQPALLVNGAAIIIDGCIFRSAQTAGLNGDLIVFENTLVDYSANFTSCLFWGRDHIFKIKSPLDLSVINCTFVDASGQTVGFSVEKVTSSLGLKARIANNYFTGFKKEFDLPFLFSVSGEDVKLERNVFAEIRPNIYAIQQTLPLLNVGTSIDSLSAHDANFLASVNRKFGDLIGCINNNCSPLYAGSSPAYSVAKDIWGQPRKNKPEVGAFEKHAQTQDVLSSGTMAIQTIPARADTINYNITSLNYEPAVTPYVHVWYDSGAPQQVVFPGKGHHAYPIADVEVDLLSGVNIDKGFGGLSNIGGEQYNVCFGFGSISTALSRECKNLITPIPAKSGGCDAIQGARCPFNGYWEESIANFPLVASYFELSQSGKNLSVDSVAVDKVTLAEYTSLSSQIIVDTTLPKIAAGATFDKNDPQDIFYTISVILGSSISSQGLHLYFQTGTTLYYVPTFSISGDTIRIESNIQGRGTYYFSRQPAVESPILTLGAIGQPLEADGGVVNINFSNGVFTTANPFILITAVPAGTKGGAELFDRGYFLQPHIVSPGLEALSSELIDGERKWGNAYYSRLLAAYTSSLELDTNKFGGTPFSLPAQISDFEKDVKVVNLAASNLSAGTLQLSITTYPKSNSNRKRTRSLEYVFAVFDGGRAKVFHTFQRVQFDKSLEVVDATDVMAADIVRISTDQWNLFSFPWEENPIPTTEPVKDLHTLVGADEWDEYHHRVAVWDNTINDYNINKNGTPGNFLYDSCRAVWVGVASQGNLLFNPSSYGGKTLDYTPFSFGVSLNQYNDFGLPFNFPIRWKTIKKATVEADANFTAHIWEFSAPNSWKLLSDTDILMPWKGYTIYPVATSNTLPKLVFPVIDSTRDITSSGIPKLADNSDLAGYQVSIIIKNTTAKSNIMIGKSSTPYQVIESPRVPGQDFTVNLAESDFTSLKGYSRLIREFNGDYKGVWPLNMNIGENSAGLNFVVDQHNLPDSLSLYLMDFISNNAYKLLADTNVSLNAQALKKGSYGLVVGSPQDIISPNHLLKFSPYPNPFGAYINLKYSLPAFLIKPGGSVYKIVIMDVQGNIYHTNTGVYSGSGYFGDIWKALDKNGKPLPAGFYLTETKVEIAGNKNLVKRSKIIKLR